MPDYDDRGSSDGLPGPNRVEQLVARIQRRGPKFWVFVVVALLFTVGGIGRAVSGDKSADDSSSRSDTAGVQLVTSTPPAPETSQADASSATTPQAEAPSTSGTCHLKYKEDLIERSIAPGVQPDSMLVGDVVLALCLPTVEAIRVQTPSGPGYCTQIARVADNPGYQDDVRPAKPLKKVLAQYGDGC